MEKNLLILKKRMNYLKKIIIGILLLLSVRLYFLQIHPSQMVNGDVVNYQVETKSDLNYRILDCNGKDMISTIKKYVVVIDTKPFRLNNYEENIEDLLALNFIMKKERPDFNYTDVMSVSENGEKLYYKVSEETYSKVKKLNNIKGVYTYIGYNSDIKEAWKIENIFTKLTENETKGSLQEKLYSYVKDNKYSTSVFNLDGSSIYHEEELNNEENKNIKMTIDLGWEAKVREILNRDEYSFLKNVGVIVSEAETGKIRVLVQKDETQPNILLGMEQMGFEPGSTFKLVTEAVALDNGNIKIDDEYVCTGAICNKNGESYPHGKMTVDQALQISCNDIFAKVGSEVGYETLMEYCEKLGFYNNVLGIMGEQKNEANGIKPKKEAGMSNISIGQTMAVTPIQMSGFVNCIANNGIYHKPTIIEGIVDGKDNLVNNFNEEGKKIFSDTTSSLMVNNMRNVISTGSGHEAKVEGIDEGGKTGTATVSKGVNHGWFVGFFEKDNKKYSIVVLAPNIGDKHPDGRELGGGNTGAPIFKDIINELNK